MAKICSLTVLLCFSLILGYYQHVIEAVALTESWTLVDNEEDETSSGSSEGSGEAQGEPSLGWVQHWKVGDVIFAKPDDIDELTKFVASQSTLDDGTVEFGSVAPEAMEDGPELEIRGTETQDNNLEKTTEKRSAKEYPPELIIEPMPNDCREEIKSIHHYPEYAMGLLVNECAAFLVGPYHAMTTADCVYNPDTHLWEKSLDMWRGRDRNLYLQKMDWESVIIPKLFFESGSKEHNWAIITFKKTKISPVWLSFAYSQKSAGRFVTAYGYNFHEMLSTVCEASAHFQESEKQLSMLCCPERSYVLKGGPVLNGYRFEGGKVPHVRAISTSQEPYQPAGGFPFDKAVAFGADMFWSACFLMKKGDYDPQCGKL